MEGGLLSLLRPIVQRCNEVGELGQGLAYSLLLGVKAVKSGSIEGEPYGLNRFEGLNWLVVAANCLLSHFCWLNSLLITLDIDYTLSLEALVLELYFISVVT